MSNFKSEHSAPVLIDQANPSEWEFYLAQQLPAGAFCSAVGCVTIRNLHAEELVLTIKTAANTTDPSRINKLEPPAGGIESGETEVMASSRENLEEAGYRTIRPQLFGYRKYYNARSNNPLYSNHTTSYMPYLWDYNPQTPGQPSDPDQASGSFGYNSLVILEKSGWIAAPELAIIRFGLDAARKYHDNPVGPYL